MRVPSGTAVSVQVVLTWGSSHEANQPWKKGLRSRPEAASMAAMNSPVRAAENFFFAKNARSPSSKVSRPRRSWSMNRARAALS